MVYEGTHAGRASVQAGGLDSVIRVVYFVAIRTHHAGDGVFVVDLRLRGFEGGGLVDDARHAAVLAAAALVLEVRRVGEVGVDEALDVELRALQVAPRAVRVDLERRHVATCVESSEEIKRLTQ